MGMFRKAVFVKFLGGWHVMLWFGKVSGIIGEFIPSGINIHKESLEVAFRKGGLESKKSKSLQMSGPFDLIHFRAWLLYLLFGKIGNLPLTKTAK